MSLRYLPRRLCVGLQKPGISSCAVTRCLGRSQSSLDPGGKRRPPPNTHAHTGLAVGEPASNAPAAPGAEIPSRLLTALLKANYSADITMTPPPAPPAQRWVSPQPSPPTDARWGHSGQTRLRCQGFSDTKPSPGLRLPGPSPGDPAGLVGNGSASLGA